MTHASRQEEAEEQQGGEQEVGLEQAEEIEHMAPEKLANATTFFTLSLFQLFYCLTTIPVFNLFVSVSLMTNRAGLKLLQNSNKLSLCLNRTE